MFSSYVRVYELSEKTLRVCLGQKIENFPLLGGVGVKYLYMLLLNDWDIPWNS